MTPVKSVAVLTDYLYPYQTTLIAGVQHALEEQGVASTVFVGRNFNTPRATLQRATDIYKLIDPSRYLGVILLASPLGVHVSDEEFARCIQSYRPLPIVSIGRRIPETSNVLLDNRPAMRSLMEHLVTVRKLKSLVFMRGIPGNYDSEEREQVFREVLHEHQLPVQEELILTGDYASSRAYLEMTRLLQRTREFEGVVCANDEMAEGAIQAITALGLRVPEDIAVVGFDDSEEFKHVVPALTTVRQPFFEQGVEAGRMLLSMAHEGAGVQDHYISPQLVVRESCGPPLAGFEFLSPSEMFRGVVEAQQKLLTLFEQVAVHAEQHSRFLTSWKEALLRRTRLDQEFFLWRDGLQGCVQKLALQVKPDQQQQVLALGFAAQSILGSALQMLHSRNQLLLVGSTKNAPGLFAVQNHEDLFEALRVHLEHLYIRHCMLVLYESYDSTPAPFAHVAMAAGTLSNLDSSVFATRDLLPESMQEELAAGSLLLTPLYVNDLHYGYLLYEPPTSGRFDEESLCHSVSHAIQQLEQTLALRSYAENLEVQVQARTRELQDEVTERMKAEKALRVANEELQRFAFLDGLTQIYNRAAFNEHLQSQWVNHLRHNRPLSLILCDVDFFKRYNDHYGHLEGDRCLQHIAQALSRSVRNRGDTVARYGGEEFVVILPETTPMGAMLVAQRIQQEVRGLEISHEKSDISPLVTVSVGVATLVPQSGMSPEDLIHMADQCLYRAKQAGRGRIMQHSLTNF
ncbi:diguanylate cyclase domain-containing protein [Deinococcus roseus]|uniref:GGDEF domain-containing protein n=1 Tax=Deinococcus roseus TaxID=392414 RepID=A0ABQ2DA72_9DEIO|nr:diguanylate cyclase [Deinococcus roseus]GGJ48780.1 hypothetical protein GCM10008938_38530 [Deinococcus roseus]